MVNFKYCPVCGNELVKANKFGAVRPCCPNPECGFVFFLDPKLVAVVLVEHEGQILVGKRNVEPAKGLWSFPGGYVNRGEEVEEAARREVKEETNLDVRLTDLLGVYSEVDNPVVVLVYLAAPLNDLSTMQAQEEEIMELAFFSPTAMPPMAFSSEKRIMADWTARHNLKSERNLLT